MADSDTRTKRDPGIGVGARERRVSRVAEAVYRAMITAFTELELAVHDRTQEEARETPGPRSRSDVTGS